MDVIIGLFIFGVTWFALQKTFVRLFGRTMHFAEGLLYPIIIALTGAAIVGQFAPPKGEQLARDVEKYNRLSNQIAGQEAQERRVQECLRQAMASRTTKSYQDCERESTP